MIAAPGSSVPCRRLGANPSKVRYGIIAEDTGAENEFRIADLEGDFERHGANTNKVFCDTIQSSPTLELMSTLPTSNAPWEVFGASFSDRSRPLR